MKGFSSLTTMALRVTALGFLLSSFVIWPLAAQEREKEALGEVRPDEMADLVAVGLNPSVFYPLPGEAVTVTAMVRNRATNAEPGVVVTLFAGPARIASQTVDFAAGQTRSLTFSWQPKEEGAIRLGLRVDPERTRPEVDWRDNELSVDVVVAGQPAAAADFAVSNLEWVGGQPSQIRATVQNNGTTGGSAPLLVQADDVVAARRLITLGAQSKQTVVIPWSSEKFRGQLSAEINPRFGSKEKKAGDNLLARDSRPAVDLRVEGLSISAAQFDPKRPRQITLSFRIVNGGRNAITRAFRTAIFPGAIKAGAAQPLDTYSLTTDGLAAGASVYVSRTFISPVGEFDARVEADADHVIAEANRANNVASGKFKILRHRRDGGFRLVRESSITIPIHLLPATGA